MISTKSSRDFPCQTKRKTENEQGNKEDDEVVKVEARLYVLNFEIGKAESLYNNFLSLDSTNQEILLDYADLEKEDFLACLEYAAKLTQVKSIYKLAS